MKLIFATRPSDLARWQTQWVMEALRPHWPELDFQEKVITTQGDKVIDRPLPEIGGKGLFTLELEAEIERGNVHAAVHSLKDLPVEASSSMAIGAIPRRANAQDALISTQGWTLDELPQEARVGTSSLRRKAQLLARRPDLQVAPIRGNVDTRVRKALQGQYDAIVLAVAGVQRLGLEAHVGQQLPLNVMLPAPGQGALAVQCRADDEETLHYLSAIEDAGARAATLAERTFLAQLGGGCSLPVGAHAGINDGGFELDSIVASLDGARVIRCHAEGGDPIKLGLECAEEALAQGAADILPQQG
jgi:hydroxymethylbilane synthase